MFEIKSGWGSTSKLSKIKSESRNEWQQEASRKDKKRVADSKNFDPATYLPTFPPFICIQPMNLPDFPPLSTPWLA